MVYLCFKGMYDAVYKSMIEAKVTVWLPEPVWFNFNGDIVENEADSIGLKLDIHIIHPEWIVFVNKTGVNTNQKDDGKLAAPLNKMLLVVVRFRLWIWKLAWLEN
jgi:hypothetical protein